MHMVYGNKKLVFMNCVVIIRETLFQIKIAPVIFLPMEIEKVTSTNHFQQLQNPRNKKGTKKILIGRDKRCIFRLKYII